MKLTEATPRNFELYALSGFLDTLWKLEVIDNVETRFGLFFRTKQAWERGYGEF